MENKEERVKVKPFKTFDLPEDWVAIKFKNGYGYVVKTNNPKLKEGDAVDVGRITTMYLEKYGEVFHCARKFDVSKKPPFVNVRLKREVAEEMISTYEFLAFNNSGEERKKYLNILRSLRKALRKD
jgi:hypothetical protein